MSASRLVEVDVCRPEGAHKPSSQDQPSLTRPRRAAHPISQGALFALFVALSPLAIAAPDVSTTGDANPAIPATSSPVDLTGTRLLLGGTNGGVGLTGSLNVSGGGSLKIAQIAAGFGGLGTGTVTLDGAGSIVTIAKGAAPFGGLDIGSWGTGNMFVTNGAKVVCTISDCQFNDIGGAAGSNGTLTISGVGSSVTGVGLLNVGQANVQSGPGPGDQYGTPGGTTTGTLVIQNGGVLGTMGNSSISAGAFGNNTNGSEHTVGNVTISGAGSIWSVTQDPVSSNQASINIASTPNATATVNVTNGGHFDLAGTQSNMGVGDGGSATLTIASGGQVSVGNMGLGNQATGVGTVIVGNGVGQSTLTATNSMGVGNSSTGLSQLTVNTGGLVNVTGTGGLGIANSPGSQGKVLVDGGQLNVNGTNAFFGVGNGGTGTLTIQNGGTVSAVNLGLGNQSTGVGTVTVGNGVGQSVLTVTNSMGVGNQSTALSQLTINTGGLVDHTGTGGLGIANSPGSQGKVLVDGGTLNLSGANSGIGVGNGGTGTLTIQNGGIVNMTGVNSGMGIGGTGTSGTVVVDDGQLSLLGSNSGVSVGNGGTGTLTITNAGQVNMSGGMSLGNQATGLGIVTVGGASSALTIGSGVTVGQQGTGANALNINAGGTVTMTGANPGGLAIAQDSGTHGAVTVNGGTLTLAAATGGIGVGNGGTGALTIINGGTVSAPNVGVGNTVNALGTVTVGNGVGQSMLTVSNSMNVGNASTGQNVLTVNAGGTVSVTGTNGSFGVGVPSGSNGAVLIDGGTLSLPGSTSFAAIGDAGTGALTIRNGGSVSASTLHIGNQTTGVGTAIVGNGSGTSVLTVATGLAVGQDGNGLLTVQSGGQVNAAGIVAIGNNPTSTGTAVVTSGGTLTAVNGISVGNQSTALSTLTVSSGGSVSVTGTNAGIGIANSVGSHGALTVDGGQLSVSGQNSSIGVGNSGTGSMTIQNGGVVTMAGQNFGVNVGGDGSGHLVVQTGGTLTTQSLNIANGPSSTGVVDIIGTTSGPQTVVTLNGPSISLSGNNPLQVGNWGNGTMTVSQGAIINSLVGNLTCGPNFCGNFIGNAAGSTGLLTLTGVGTTANIAGSFIVGNGSVFTQAHDGFTFGTPGGTTNATVQVLNGATLNTNNSALSTGPGGGAPLGTEHTIANVTIDGAGSTWEVTRNPMTGQQAFLGLSSRPTATATIDITNGGRLVISGSPPGAGQDTSTPGINMTSGGGTSTINVAGVGSAVVLNGQNGIIQVGRNGGTATLNINSGGQVFGNLSNGLLFMNVGRQGSNAFLNVDGGGSQLTLSGVGGTGSLGIGAGMSLGLETGSVGTATVTNGGAILLRDGGLNATAGGVGMTLGRDAGASGSLTVSGPGSILTIEQTGAGSTSSPGIIIGRGGGGQVLVTNGGTILIHDNGQLTASGGGGIAIGRDTGSTGSLTVSGVGSSITVEQTGSGTVVPAITVGRAGTGQMLVTDGATVAVNGNVQRNFIVGSTGIGTLTVSNGAEISASWFGVGINAGGTGTATIDNAAIRIDGFAVSADTTIFGGSVRVGRGLGATGTLNLVNGAQITLNTSVANSSVNLGGTGDVNFGDGTLHMSGGSSIAFTGTGATPRVLIGHSGTGLFTMDSGSSLTLPTDGRISIGTTSTGSGTLTVGGSTIVTGSLIVGDAGVGVFNQSSGTTSATNMIVGNQSTGNGSVNLSGGALNVTGNAEIGKAGTGTFVQTGGTTTIGGQLVLGADAGSTGTMNVSGGSSVTLTGAGASVVIGQNGTGVMTMIEGSTLALFGDGKVIVGAHAGASGTLELQGASSIQGLALFGIGHDGTAPTGPAAANVYLDQGSSVTATKIYLGDGCLGGNGGVIHGNFIMDGQAVVNCAPPVLAIVHPGMIDPTGILHPGRSPGVLTFDGSFDFIHGTIVLEVESDGHGGFLTDEIIFTLGTVVDLTKANIQFAFLGNTDPNAFLPFWDLDTFLKTVSSGGTVEGISALGNLDNLFAEANFVAQSDAYVITDFTFDPVEGVTSIDATPVATAVPEPGSMMLLLLGCLLLAFARRRTAASTARRH